MTKITKLIKEERKNKKDNKVINFMNGISFEVNPLDTLKMVSASSIFGEPQYYRDGLIKDGYLKTNKYFEEFSVLPTFKNEEKTSQYMERIIDAALNYDFIETIKWAKTLREEYFMRLNPQVIMVRAAIHPKRKEITEKERQFFSEIEKYVMKRADEPISQFEYYLFLNKNKNNLPNILKRAWKKKLESLSLYEINKYKNAGIGLIDTVRISHAHNNNLDELLQTGSVKVKENEITWEQLRSKGLNWNEILAKIDIPYMALLRNLVGIFSEIKNEELQDKLLKKLKDGVCKSMQFPFRFYNAYLKVEENANSLFRPANIMDALNECLEISLNNMPKLKGKTICLTDNSGSAWGTVTSEYGSAEVAIINNLSSVIVSINSDEGVVGKFGDEIYYFPISKKDGILTQTKLINETKKVGQSTENGIWLFFNEAIEKKIHYDNIFVFSDMQAGHNELYGLGGLKFYEFMKKYDIKNPKNTYIDVAKLLEVYRKTVNPKVNFFSVQTAGYDNIVVPEYGYRTNLLYGWTGKELIFADTMIKMWDELEIKESNKQK